MKSIGVAALCAAFFLPAPAEAQMRCGDRDDIARVLLKKHGERPVAAAITVTGSLIEVFASEGGATWTIVQSRPHARACLMSWGEGWKHIEQKVEGEES